MMTTEKGRKWDLRVLLCGAHNILVNECWRSKGRGRCQEKCGSDCCELHLFILPFFVMVEWLKKKKGLRKKVFDWVQFLQNLSSVWTMMMGRRKRVQILRRTNEDFLLWEPRISRQTYARPDEENFFSPWKMRVALRANNITITTNSIWIQEKVWDQGKKKEIGIFGYRKVFLSWFIVTASKKIFIFFQYVNTTSLSVNKNETEAKSYY